MRAVIAAVTLALAACAAPARGGQLAPVQVLEAEWEALNRRADWHLEMAVWHLDELDAVTAEMARVGYRIRRHDDTTPPVLDLGAGP